MQAVLQAGSTWRSRDAQLNRRPGSAGASDVVRRDAGNPPEYNGQQGFGSHPGMTRRPHTDPSASGAPGEWTPGPRPLAGLDMPLSDAMMTQRAIRRVLPDPVDDAVVLKCIELISCWRAPWGWVRP
jgi:hypothetical protein